MKITLTAKQTARIKASTARMKKQLRAFEQLKHPEKLTKQQHARAQATVLEAEREIMAAWKAGDKLKREHPQRYKRYEEMVASLDAAARARGMIK